MLCSKCYRSIENIFCVVWAGVKDTDLILHQFDMCQAVSFSWHYGQISQVLRCIIASLLRKATLDDITYYPHRKDISHSKIEILAWPTKIHHDISLRYILIDISNSNTLPKKQLYSCGDFLKLYSLGIQKYTNAVVRMKHSYPFIGNKMSTHCLS